MQIWLTYPEMADLLSCPQEEARSFVADLRLSKKSSRDGMTQVKLNADLTLIFLARLVEAVPPADELNLAIDALRDMHERMSSRGQAAPASSRMGLQSSR
jgi:hypothetical protein